MSDGRDDENRSFRRRQYGSTSTGPFIVIAESMEGSFDLAKLSKQVIQAYKKDYVKAMQMSRRKAKFLMATREAANHLAAAKHPAVKFNIPQRLVECLGVASIEGVENEDLVNLISFEKSKLYQTNNPEVIEVRRMQKRGEKGQVPLPLVVITFSGNVLPSHVELDNVLYPVRKYTYPVRQCRQCWRFGHMMKQCKSKRRCCSCQAEISDNEHDCIGGPVCVNCSGDHRADDRNKCPAFGKKKEEEKKRQISFSQGKTDWFAALSANPDSGLPIASCSQQIPLEDPVEVPRAAEMDKEALPVKRKNPEGIDISDDEEFPPLKQRSAYKSIGEANTAVIIMDDAKDQIDESDESGDSEEYLEELKQPEGVVSTTPNDPGKDSIPNRL